MSGTVAINLTRAIKSAEISDNHGISTESSNFGGVNSERNDKRGELLGDLEAERIRISQLCQAFQGLVAKLDQFYNKILAEHGKEIARLSTEIARKILVQKVEKGDYEIESIVEEALKNAPVREDLVVHLNPEDLAQYQKLQQADAIDTSAGIKFVADSNIGRAECLLETGKGIIESLINERLKQIGKALNKVE